MGSSPRIELLWWQGCPSTDRALSELRAVVAAAGLDPGAIETREVESAHSAEQERFVGSPTIRIDGEDVQSPGPDEPIGLSCRVYRLRDGRYSPTPDPEDLKEALEKALEKAEVSQ